MKKITRMSDSQKNKLARWAPTLVTLGIAIITVVFNYGYISARMNNAEKDIETQAKRVTLLENKQQSYDVLMEKIKNVEDNTKSTNEQVVKLAEEIKDIFKNYELKHK